MTLQVKHNGQSLDVPGTRRGEPLVRAISQEQIEHESELGLAFEWPSADADIDTGDSILTLKNTSENFLVLTGITGIPANVAAIYTYYRGNSETALVGTAVVGVNINGAFASQTFKHEVKSDETALADATLTGGFAVSTVESHEHSLAGHILGFNDFIQINQITECTSGRVVLKGFFIPELI